MGTVVNYIWMREDEQTPHTIPTYFFCRLQQNAARYPDTEFRLWVESSEAYQDYAIPPNVTPYMLSDIPALSEMPLFSSRIGDESEKSIWIKSDVVRLLVLKHVLGESACDTAIYADFDALDLLLNDDRLRIRLNTYGVAFGATIYPQRKHRIMSPIENGYIAFRKVADDLLDFIINHTMSIKVNHRDDVFEAIKFALSLWADSPNSKKMPFPRCWHERIGNLPILFPTNSREDIDLQAIPASRQNPYAARAVYQTPEQPKTALHKAPDIKNVVA